MHAPDHGTLLEEKRLHFGVDERDREVFVVGLDPHRPMERWVLELEAAALVAPTTLEMKGLMR